MGLVLVVLLGMAWLVGAYVQQRTLYSDEAMLAQNFVERDGWALLEPLDGSQIAPVGFLFAQDVVADALGPDEVGLRFLPMIAAALAIPLMFLAVRQCLGPFGGLTALVMLVFSGAAIYWGTQNKPYSFDLLMGVALLVSAGWAMRQPGRLAAKVVWGAAALVSIAFSLPAVCWVAGTGLALLIDAARRRDRRAALTVVAVGLPAAIAFGAYHFLVLAPVRADAKLMGYMGRFWADDFMPWPWRDPAGGVERFGKLFINPLSLEHMAGLGMVLFVVGLAYLLVRRRGVWWLMACPLAMAVLVSMLGRYPLAERLALFALPLLAIPIGAGLESLWDTRGRWARGMAVVFAAALLAYPLMHTGRVDALADFAPILDRVSEQVRPGDTVYIYHGGQLTIDFYREQLGRWPLDGAEVWRGAAGWHNPMLYAREFEQMRGRPRVWLVFARTDPSGLGDEGRIVRAIANNFGRKVDAIHNDTTSSYLYDFTVAANADP